MRSIALLALLAIGCGPSVETDCPEGREPDSGLPIGKKCRDDYGLITEGDPSVENGPK